MDKFKILLVDDDEEMHQQIPQLFQDERLEFHHSYSFKDSVVKLASSSFDLMISDYDLGVKSGIDLANISKKYRPNTDIFLLIVNFEFSSVQPLASAAKVLQCFEKPFVAANLIQGILTLLNKKIELLQKLKEPFPVEKKQVNQEEIVDTPPTFATIDRNKFSDAPPAPKVSTKPLTGVEASIKTESTPKTNDELSQDPKPKNDQIVSENIVVASENVISNEVVITSSETSTPSKEIDENCLVSREETLKIESDSEPIVDNSRPLTKLTSSQAVDEENRELETSLVATVNEENHVSEDVDPASQDLTEVSTTVAPPSRAQDSEEDDDETFDLEELVSLSSSTKNRLSELGEPELDLPSPIKSIDSDLTEPEVDPNSVIENSSNEKAIEKKFVRPSAFKTLDGDQVELQEVNEKTSLNVKVLKDEHNEKIALAESNAFLEELVNEVDEVKGSEPLDLDNLGKMAKVKVNSIQEIETQKELTEQNQLASEEANAQKNIEIQQNASQETKAESEDSGFGFSSAPKSSSDDFNIGFDNLSGDVNLNPTETIEANPFECKFPEERPRKDPYLRVVIAQNILSAALVCYPLEDDHHTMESVKKELELKNVVYNIDFELIEKLIQKVNLMREPILGEIIATGHSAVHGKNGYIDLSFSNSLDVSLDETGDGKVDFKNIYKIDCVREGDFLGEIIPPTMAIPGKGVTGFVLKGKNGKPKPILPGKGARFDKTTQKFYSMIEGQPFLRGNKIIVSPLYVVPNGVDYSTGNISFVGSVHVCGDVGSGFTVEAEGDILVEGIVEGATLKAGGSVKVQRGFAGADKGAIYAEGDVRCKYISNGTVEASGNVLVEDSIINSNVTSHAKIKVFDKKGNILGGLVRAQDSIRVLNLGSEFGVGTKIVVGSHFILREQLGEINKSQKMNSLKMDKISKGIQSFTNLANGKNLEKSHMLKLKQLKAILKKLKVDEDSFESKKDELLKEFNKKCMSKIYVRNNAYPGVSVQIGNTVYALNDVFTNCSFFEDRFKAVVKLGIYEEE
ncbi:MAG: DUF342 domain-containing protein [Candidatus Cloacimonetes bacterium]|nr:DUF342 domain-containing protein [Candidatus Cloacimonadota bacterium]